MKTTKTLLMGAVITAVAALILPVMVIAGNLEPAGAPAPTMKTLDQIPPTWSQTLPAAERFELVLGGVAVLDKETGLVWEQSPSLIPRSWKVAQDHCYGIELGGRMGWHLPTIEQLTSLVDTSNNSPSLQSGHPFSNVQSNNYWAANQVPDNLLLARSVWFGPGSEGSNLKSDTWNAWCVRGGQSHNAY